MCTNETRGTSPRGENFLLYILKGTVRKSMSFFQGLSSSLDVTAGGVSESLATMRQESDGKIDMPRMAVKIQNLGN